MLTDKQLAGIRGACEDGDTLADITKIYDMLGDVLVEVDDLRAQHAKLGGSHLWDAFNDAATSEMELRAELDVLRDAAEERLPEAEQRIAALEEIGKVRIDALTAESKRLQPLAEIGAAVQRMGKSIGSAEIVQQIAPHGHEWFVWNGKEHMGYGETPEAALAAAGLMPAPEDGEPEQGESCHH